MMTLPAVFGGMVAKKIGWEIFRKVAINPALEHRWQQFYEAFLDAVAEEKKWNAETPELDRKLSALLENEHGQEALARAYRQVSFSASRNLGPRVIALLTAELILAERIATNSEEKMFVVAEQLSDGELRVFAKSYWIMSGQKPGTPGPKPDEQQVLYLFEKQVAGQQFDVDPKPSFYDADLWKVRLKNLDILHEAENTIVATKQRTLSVSSRYQKLAILIDRATGPAT